MALLFLILLVPLISPSSSNARGNRRKDRVAGFASGYRVVMHQHLLRNARRVLAGCWRPAERLLLFEAAPRLAPVYSLVSTILCHSYRLQRKAPVASLCQRSPYL